MTIQETVYTEQEVQRRLLRIYETILSAEEDEMAKKLLINEKDLEVIIRSPERKHVDQVIMFMGRQGWDIEYGEGGVELRGSEKKLFEADLRDAVELVRDLDGLRMGAS